MNVFAILGWIGKFDVFNWGLFWTWVFTLTGFKLTDWEITGPLTTGTLLEALFLETYSLTFPSGITSLTSSSLPNWY